MFLKFAGSAALTALVGVDPLANKNAAPGLVEPGREPLSHR